MNVAQQTLLTLLNSYIHGESAIVEQSVSWEEVFQLSMEQGVAGVVFQEIENNYQRDPKFNRPETELIAQWYAVRQSIKTQNKKVNAVLGQLAKLMNDADIPSVLLKGQGLAQQYKHPLSRNSGDIDWYVGNENYDKAKKLLRATGWLNGGKARHEDIKHMGFYKDGVSIELHRECAFIPGGKRTKYLHKGMEVARKETKCGFALGDSFIRVLPPTENLVFTFIHMFSHFIGGGVALRQVMDVAVMLERKEYSLPKLKEWLQETGFMTAWQTFGCIYVEYLGFSKNEFPLYDSKYENKMEQVLELIFFDGEREYELQNSKAKDPKNLVGNYTRLLKSYLRIWKLMPWECYRFLTHQLYRTLLKYVNFYKYNG